MISIVIPLYNKEKLIGATIQSILNQTYQEYEIVVVNDGSTDNSVAEVDKIHDSRIRLINQPNAGVSAARNRGIVESNGDLIALMDADDLWKPNYLETQIDLVIKYPKCDVFAVNYEFKDSHNNSTPAIIKRLPFNETDGVLSNYFEVATYSHPPITSISVMARKGVFESVGGFPINIKSGEDLLTWARLACRYEMAFSQKVCAVYNLGEGYDFANKPPRRQDERDPVGKELKKLFREFKPIGIKKYIGHWHKMRSSVAIRYYDRMEAFTEAIKSFYYYPQTKILPFIIMPVLPNKILYKLFISHK